MTDNRDSDRKRSILILYGSETGNSQEVAEELGRTAERLHFVTHVRECDEVKAVSSFRLSHDYSNAEKESFGSPRID